MLIINKKYKGVMEQAKKEILRRKKEEDNLFSSWCIALSVDKNSKDGKILFDYMFNDRKSNIRFK